MTLSPAEEELLLSQDWTRIRSLLEEKNRLLNEFSGKCALYEKVSRERAQRKRKNVSDPSGYALVASREIIDYYEEEYENEGRKSRLPIVAYKTTLSMPYPPQLGFSELRQLLHADLVGEKAASSDYKDSTRKIGLGFRIGIDKVDHGLPADGVHPGPLEGTGWDPQTCILYRVVLNIGKKFPEADIYTTQPLNIPVSFFEV